MPLLDPEDDPRSLRDRLRREPRDADWAPRAESALKAAYANVPYVGGANPVTIRCSSTLCQVRGRLSEGLSGENTNVAMATMQGKPLADQLERDGLAVRAGIFGGVGKQTTYRMFPRRK